MDLTAVRVSLRPLYDRHLVNIVEWFTRHEAAEAEIAAMLADEPGWVDHFEVVRVDFAGAGVRVERA